jgi:hypothetical protein
MYFVDNLAKFLSNEYHQRQKQIIGGNNTLINPLTPELNPSSQRCLSRLFTGDFNF